ncbi:MAG TPA: C4-dicarboxylate TRAP transporter substrate-binding protein [Tissierellaceae bacterium]|nr:C4-dicarboxylate TRAP transporter substrate-binding protein [Tissierellaceae bacterium]
MKRFKSLSILIAIILVMSSILTACGNDDSKDVEGDDDYKLELKLSHVFSPDEQLAKSMDLVADRIREKTNGAIDIQTYPQAQLATYKDGLEQVVRGAEFISVEDPSYLADYVPDFQALVGPFLYEEIDEYTGLLKTDLVQDMIDSAEEEGIKILGLDYVFGFRNLVTNEIVETPEDLKGLKLRVPESQLFIDTINAMGATATSLPFSETISGVQQGVVDGLEGSEFSNLGTKMYEVAKNVAITKHFLGTCGVYISTEVWEEIPEEYQTIIEEEFIYGGKEMIEIIEDSHDETVEELEAEGVKFNEVDMNAFREATESVYDNMDGVSENIYDKLQEELEELR